MHGSKGVFPLDRLLRQCDQDREERHIRTYTLYFYFLNIFYFYFFSTSFFFFYHYLMLQYQDLDFI